MIPKSGGDYAYISDAFGPLPAFLYLWVALFVLVPTGNAITALTFAQYILQPVWPACKPPYEAVRLLAAVITCKTNVIAKLRMCEKKRDLIVPFRFSEDGYNSFILFILTLLPFLLKFFFLFFFFLF